MGVAGNRHLLPGHSTWCFNPLSGRLDLPNLVGAIHHGSPLHSTLDAYGPARAGVLQQAGVRFDPDLAFHFYDLDLCRTALVAGLRLGVWPLPLIHASGGNFGSPSWQAALALYHQKWKDPPATQALPIPPPCPCLLPTAR